MNYDSLKGSVSSRPARQAFSSGGVSRQAFLSGGVSRRRILKTGAAFAGAALAAPYVRRAEAARLKVGVLLPNSGVLAFLGTKITQGMELAINQSGGLLGGREVEWIRLDSETDPAKAPERTARLVRRGCDIVVGPVHSGVLLGMLRVLGGTDTTLLIPNAGAGAATGEYCGENIFRTSFSNWQAAWPMGRFLAQRGLRRVTTMSWNYAAGTESVQGFTEGFASLGGEISEGILAPYPAADFHSYMTKLAASDAEAIYAFFSGASAVQFVKQYHEAGLRDRLPLYGVFLTEGTLEAQGVAAEGLETTMHYADDLPFEANRAFRSAYREAYGVEPDVFSVQGYDTGALLVHAAQAVGGDTDDKPAFHAALRSFRGVSSPRGAWHFSRAQNPVQDFYLRRAAGGQNRYIETIAQDVTDPAQGCTLV